VPEDSNLKRIVENGPEIYAYMYIQQLGGAIWRLNHDAADGRIPDSPKIDRDIAEMRKQQLELIKSLSKYGVEPLNEDGHPTEQYWKWYHWWNNYIEGLPQIDWQRLDKEMSENIDVSNWRPPGSWKE